MTEEVGVGSLNPQEGEGADVFLSPQEGARLLWMSYRFSQGSSDLQTALFQRIAKDNSQYEIAPESESDIIDAARDMILKTVSSGKYHSLQALHGVESSITQEFTKMITIFNGHVPISSSDSDMFAAIINMDSRLLSERLGRPKPEVGGGQLGDHWGSQAVSFVLRGEPTGHPAFDKIFSDLRALFESDELSEVYADSIEKLRSVIQIYNEHHPESPYSDQDMLEKLERAKGKAHEEI